MDLDVRVQPRLGEGRGREHRLDCLAVAQLDERGVTDPLLTVIGEERSTRDHVLEIAAVGEVPSLSRPDFGVDSVCLRGAVADDEKTWIASRVALEVPHRPTQRVAPGADHHVGVDPGDVAGLFEGEGPSRRGVGELDHVHAAGRCRSVRRQRRTARDHRIGVPIHE